MGTQLSDRVRPISYPITEIVSEARTLEKKGKDIIYLNIGDPPQYGFSPSPEVCEKLCDAVKSGHNSYSDPSGLPELKNAIIDREKQRHGVSLTADDVFVTMGSSEALQYVIASLIDSGDEGIIPGAWYPLYPNYIKLYNGRVVTYDLIEDKEWFPDIDDMRSKITEKTQFILLNNPNNPTGAVYDEKTIKAILDIAAERNLIVIADEVYNSILFDDGFTSTASIARDTCVITTNGVSKGYGLTGWRLGWLMISDPTETFENALKSHIDKLTRTRMCASTPIQKACAFALNMSAHHINQTVEKLKQHCDYVYKRLTDTEGVSTKKPAGSLFIFPKIEQMGDLKNDNEFVRALLRQKGVCVVPGTGFGEVGLNHFREVFLEDMTRLEDAHNRLEEFMLKLTG